jgi:signal transduction histidine kinase
MCGLGLSANGAGRGDLSAFSVLTNVAQFHRFANLGHYDLRRIQVEGVVCWVDRMRPHFILVDDSGALRVQAGADAPPVEVGDRLGIEGIGSALRSGPGSVMVPPLLVDNDSLHDPKEEAASIQLKAGFQSLRLCWFNSQGEGLLRVSYAGPELPRQRVPDTALFHRRGPFGGGPTNLVPGLVYRGYEGEWNFVPDFNRVPLVATGVATNFEVGVASRRQSVGLEFSGYLHVPKEGLYTFFLESDDGSILYLNDSQLRVIPLGKGAAPPPRRLAIGHPLSEDEVRWSEMEGQVTQVQRGEKVQQLELVSGKDHLTMEVVDGLSDFAEVLLGSRLRATGICQGSRNADSANVVGALWVPSWEDVQLLAIAPERWAVQPVVQIADLPHRSGLVRLRGTLVSVTTNRMLVIEDPTGRVQVQCSRMPSVAPGNLVEVLGRSESSAEGKVLGAHLQEWVLPDTGQEAPQLTTIKQVRSLSAEVAQRQYPVKIQGVVTAHFANGMSIVIQDADLGVFVSIPLGNTRGRLEIGDACEVLGVTQAGAFAPMIKAEKVIHLGLGRLPEPVQPSIDQIVNGSLDSQYVEIQGVVTGVDERAVRLFTRVGRLDMDLGGRSVQDWQQYTDALVRIRGCMLAVYDRTTGLVRSGRIHMEQPSVTVDLPAPADPFALETRTVAGLRSFDPHASAFQRVKVAGQVVHAQPGLFCLMDGTNGLRFYPKNPTPLRVGAMTEVVGILDLSAASPVLHEAFVRCRQNGPLPPPRELAGTNLLNGAHDATRVRVQSVLIGMSREDGVQVLELNTGHFTHTAWLNTNLGCMGPIPIGSRVAVTGVYLGEGGNWAVGRDIQRFSLALSFPEDVRIVAKPPWWTPRRLLAILGALGLVLWFAVFWIWVLRRQVEERTRLLAQQVRARQRVEQQRAIEQERSRLARDLHDDLGGGLTEISMLGSLAADPALGAEKKMGYLGQLTDRARQLVSTLDEIVWAVNPRYDSVGSLAGYYSLYAQRFLGLASVACHLEVPETLPEYPLESKVRHSLFLALKEVLNNVVRHAHATEVRLDVQVKAGELLISVMDNGCGLEVASGAPGLDGLSNLQARMSSLGGRCEIHSRRGEGTTVRLGLRLKHEE